MRTRHPECQEKRDLALRKIPEFFAKALVSDLEAARFKNLIDEIGQSHLVTEPEKRQLILAGFRSAITAALSDHILTATESERIHQLAAVFGVDLTELGDLAMTLAKATLLRVLDEGYLEQVIAARGSPPHMHFQSGEGSLWTFGNVAYYTSKSKTEYVGGSQAISVRLAKGVYYRIGATKGEAIRTDYLSKVADGSVTISNKAIYFLSNITTVKLPLAKVMAVQLFSDAIQISREGINSRPFMFAMDAPSFAANLIARVK
jgi:hypothetical protein